MVVYCDRLPHPGETVLGGQFHMFGGGKGANQAVAAARAGGAITFLGAYGPDTFGTWEFNSTDQLDAVPSAVNKGSGWVSNGGAVPAASFAVYGN